MKRVLTTARLIQVRAFPYSLTLLGLLLFNLTKEVSAEDIIILAAASLSTALEEIIEKRASQKGNNETIRISYGGTGGLSRQVENGLPAHIFISASRPWIDRLIKKKLLEPSLVKDILKNQLALIANKRVVSKLEIQPSFPIAEALGNGRLAIGETNSVPAGIYAKQALESLGCWEAIKDKLAPAKDVRAALRLVELQESELGIVYKTDAAASDDVYIVDVFEPNLHDPIYYTVAILSQSDLTLSQSFYNYLTGEDAFQTFEKYGFKRP